MWLCDLNPSFLLQQSQFEPPSPEKVSHVMFFVRRRLFFCVPMPFFCGWCFLCACAFFYDIEPALELTSKKVTLTTGMVSPWTLFEVKNTCGWRWKKKTAQAHKRNKTRQAHTKTKDKSLTFSGRGSKCLSWEREGVQSLRTPNWPTDCFRDPQSHSENTAKAQSHHKKTVP